MPDLKLLFFTACDGEYEQFIAPYIFGALHSNREAKAEICVADPAAYRSSHAASLEILESRFANRFLIRGGDFSGRFRNSVRFLETPELKSEYTYIGDIDILILEDIAPYHIAKMEKTGLPYSNVIRPNSQRLSGLHFTRTEAYYPLPRLDGLDLTCNDEMLLYQIVARRQKLPPVHSRPVHGFHFSIRRNPCGSPPWDLEEKHIPAYLKLRNDSDWQALLPTLGPLYWLCLLIAENVLHARHPSDFAACDDVKLIRLENKLRWRSYAP